VSNLTKFTAQFSHFEKKIILSLRFSDVYVVLEIRPWPRGASRRLEANFYGLGLGLGTCCLGLGLLGLQALALRAALTFFCHHHRTHGPTTTTK